MKKQSLAVFSIVFLLLIGIAIAGSSKKEVKLENAKEVAPGVFSLGTAVVDGEELEGYAIVKKKKENAGKGGSTSTNCYAFLAKGTKWKNTEQYVLDTTNANGLTAEFVAASYETSLNAWDEQVAFDVFGTRDTLSVVDGPDTVAPDNKNEVMFGSIDSPGAVAVTIVWGIFSGPIFNRKIVEFDQVYDEVDFTWGDATVNSTVMDFENVAAHENGHAGGMGHPSDSCTEETMYRFVSTGETKKRTLNTGDITGIQKLYG